jgi:hypothetical protein
MQGERRHPLGCDDHDLTADVAVDQGSDARLPGLPSNGPEQQRRGELVPADYAQVDDVTLGSSRLKIRSKMLDHPVAPGPFNLGGNDFALTHELLPARTRD